MTSKNDYLAFEVAAMFLSTLQNTKVKNTSLNEFYDLGKNVEVINEIRIMNATYLNLSEAIGLQTKKENLTLMTSKGTYCLYLDEDYLGQEFNKAREIIENAKNRSGDISFVFEADGLNQRLLGIADWESGQYAKMEDSTMSKQESHMMNNIYNRLRQVNVDLMDRKYNFANQDLVKIFIENIEKYPESKIGDIFPEIRN